MAKQVQNQAAKTVVFQPEVLPALVDAVGAALAPSYSTSAQEFDVSQHAIFSETLRPKKKVRKVVKGVDGQPLLDSKGQKQYTTEQIEVNRIGLPLQELIVKRRVSFMNVGNIQLIANPIDDGQKRLFEVVKKHRTDNKLDFLEKEVATRMLSELQVAKIWYSEPVDPIYWTSIPGAKGNFRMRCKIVSPQLGYKLLPVFDDYGNLLYFGVAYESRRSLLELSGITDGAQLAQLANEKDKRIDIYADTAIYKFRQVRSGEAGGTSDGWIVESVTPHSYGKIPVVYYFKPEPPWAKVQKSIARLETLLSNFGDTNDYHASPVFVMMGKVGAKVLEKGEQGKSLQITGDNGDAKYVTWDQATEAVKLEIDTLVKFIYTCTQTPQMSMEDLKGLGATSGVAYDRIFIDAHLAARDELDGDFGQGIQRDINLAKAFAAAIDTTLVQAAQTLEITYEVPIFRINDDSETLSLLQKATGGAKLLSQRSGVGRSPYTKNVEEEMKLIEEEEKEALASKAETEVA